MKTHVLRVLFLHVLFLHENDKTFPVFSEDKFLHENALFLHEKEHSTCVVSA